MRSTANTIINWASSLISPIFARTGATATLPVVVWSHDEKVVKRCAVSVATTFADVIDSLGLAGVVKSALVGHRDVPFKLLPGDFAPADDYDVDSVPTWTADTFEGRVVDIAFWMSHMDHASAESIADAKKRLAKKAHLEKTLATGLVGYEIHLFTYDHRDDCCEGEHGAFTKRDPATTTRDSSLWLRLEKEFLTGGRHKFDPHGWATTPVAGVGALLDALKALGSEDES